MIEIFEGHLEGPRDSVFSPILLIFGLQLLIFPERNLIYIYRKLVNKQTFFPEDHTWVGLTIVCFYGETFFESSINITLDIRINH